jgi:hypothetical protein
LRVRAYVSLILRDGFGWRRSLAGDVLLGAFPAAFAHGSVRPARWSGWRWGWATPAGSSSAVRGTRVREDLPPGIGRVELKRHVPGADAHDGADLEQIKANRIRLRLGPLAAFQTQPARRSTGAVGCPSSRRSRASRRTGRSAPSNLRTKTCPWGPGVGPQHDACFRPSPARLSYDAANFLHCARAASLLAVRRRAHSNWSPAKICSVSD